MITINVLWLYLFQIWFSSRICSDVPFGKPAKQTQDICAATVSEGRQTFWAGAEQAGTRTGAGSERGGQGSQAKNYNIGCWNEEIMLSKWKAVFLDKDRIETPYQRGIPSGYPRRLTTQWSPNNVLPMQQKQTGMQKMSSMLSGSIPPLLLTVFNLGRCAYTVDSDW